MNAVEIRDATTASIRKKGGARVKKNRKQDDNDEVMSKVSEWLDALHNMAGADRATYLGNVLEYASANLIDALGEVEAGVQIAQASTELTAFAPKKWPNNPNGALLAVLTMHEAFVIVAATVLAAHGRPPQMAQQPEVIQ